MDNKNKDLMKLRKMISEGKVLPRNLVKS